MLTRSMSELSVIPADLQIRKDYVACSIPLTAAAAATATAATTVIVLLEEDDVQEDGRSDQGELLLGRRRLGEGGVIGILLGAALVGPPGPQGGDLRLPFLGGRFDRFEGVRVANDEGQLAALALRAPAVAAGHDAAAGDAGVGADPVLAGAVGVDDVELGHEDEAVADELGPADDLARGVLGLQVGRGAAAGAAGLALLVGGHDVPGAVRLGQALGDEALLAGEAGLVLVEDGGRDRPRVLDVLGLAAAGHAPAARAHAPRALLVDPGGMREVVWVRPGIEVVRLVDDPVDGGLEAREAAALGGGLGDDELLPALEALHGQRRRGAAENRRLVLAH
eukprot:CAMPEP_0181044274 /NCGR_PEP_ID=MMETSP1070-20121207/13171_1 /TAXON_ID=265543 /ORGANISM="Minutocellus polymorphus, Strain NH13" /LENGTH=336 /DNA_ID=CAMNT_0023122693 /DNA_START=292 /DNA_END=1299 /DNA_ORIENTATION=+